MPPAARAGGPFGGFGGPGNVRYEFRTSGDPGEFSDFFRVFFGEDAEAGAFQPTSGPGRGTRPTGGLGFDDILAGMGLGGQPSGSGPGGWSGRRQYRTGCRRRPTRPRPRSAWPRHTTAPSAWSRSTASGSRSRSRAAPTAARGSGSPAGAPAAATCSWWFALLPDARFTRRGADLERELPLTLEEALLGAEVKVETLKGSVLLKIPAGTQAGRVFRLTGQGMPRFNATGYGDLYVKARIILPTDLSPEAKTAARAFFDLVDQPSPR